MPNRWNFVFSKPKLYAMQYATTTCPTMLLRKLANICINHSKYTSYEYWNLHNMKLQILCNTKYWVTHRYLLHRCLMRRGTPLTRYWFMPALNTQRFANVLAHQLTCFSHAEYHFCVTVYQSDVQSEPQSVCKENLTFAGFTLLSQTHTSIDMHSSCRIPLLCDCLSIWCAIWDTTWSQLWHLRGFNFSPEFICVHQIQLCRPQNKAVP